LLFVALCECCSLTDREEEGWVVCVGQAGCDWGKGGGGGKKS
jgi:hypothetical protein